MASQTKVVMLLILATAGTALAVANPSSDQAVMSAFSDKCPIGWSYYSGRCYVYNGTRLDWASAEKFCQKMDAHLVSIHSENEHQQIKALIRTYDPAQKPTHIGLSDCQMNKIFFWSDGTKLTFKKWSPGQPDNKNSKECCVQMNYARYKNWNDFPCFVQHPFVCAKKSG